MALLTGFCGSARDLSNPRMPVLQVTDEHQREGIYRKRAILECGSLLPLFLMPAKRLPQSPVSFPPPESASKLAHSKERRPMERLGSSRPDMKDLGISAVRQKSLARGRSATHNSRWPRPRHCNGAVRWWP